MSSRRLCAVDALDATRAKGLTIDVDGRAVDLFLVRDAHGGVYGYVDRCPHAGSPLAWREDDYLDENGEFILCATHGAMFRIEDGRCLGGPCRGRGLQPVAVRIEGDAIHLDLP